MDRKKSIGNGKHLKKRLNKYKLLYPLIAIPIIVVFIYNYMPMVGILMAFKKYKITLGFAGIFTSPDIGIENFRRLFTSSYFYTVLRNTLYISLYKLVMTFPAPIIFALLLNELKSKLFKRFVQTVSYLPHFLSMVIVYGLVTAILSPTYGLVNMIIENIGGTAQYFLINTKYFVSILMMTDIWMTTGWGAIIYLAAITSINPELYNSAEIDGANKIQKIIYITLPGISQIIILILIFRVGSILNAGFEQILLFYSPPVYPVADIIDTYVYRRGLLNAEYGYSTAVGLFKSIIALVLIVTTNKIAHRYGYHGVW